MFAECCGNKAVNVQVFYRFECLLIYVREGDCYGSGEVNRSGRFAVVFLN